MGSAEEKKPGFSSSKWMTIILIAVLVILAVIFIWVLKDPRGFDRFKKRKTPTKPDLKPGAMNQQLYSPGGRHKLELVDSRLREIAELSWQSSESPRA